MKYFISILVFLLLGLQLHAQFVKDSSDNIALLIKTSEDSITLRWAPGSYRLWRAAISRGYTLERREYGKGEFVTLTGGPIKPYSLEEFRQKTDIDNDYIALSAEMMHGDIMKTAANAEQFSDFLLAHEEQENRHSLALLAADLSPVAAQAQALRYVDRDVESGMRYEYRISVADLPEDWNIESVTKMAGALAPRQTLKVLDVVTENTEHGVFIKWDRIYNDAFFTAYHIERAAEGSQDFAKLNKKPLLFSADENGPTYNFYLDSLEMNNRAFQYRVKGVDAFGDESAPSDIATGMGIDLTGPMPPAAVKAYENKDGKMVIEWLNQSLAPDHAGFYIGRSASPTGPFTKINDNPLSIKKTSFIDENAVDYQANYYIVIAADALGNENNSHMAMGLWKDSTPPAQPAGLSGNVDTLGYVTLIWTPGTEPDLLGYRVYVANAPDVEYFQVTDDIVEANFFVDSVSLQTLSEKVYYKIVAIDRNFNPSAYSEILPLQRPDKIAPTSPVFSGYKVINQQVILEWQKSSSKDVVNQNIYRRTDDAQWTFLTSVSADEMTLTDSTATVGQHFSYRIEAVDDAGLISKESKPLRVFVSGYTSIGPMEGIKAVYDRDKGGIHISWPGNPDVSKYIIYRAAGGEEMTYYADTREDQFVDTNLYKSAGSFNYAVQAVYSDGNKSSLSQPISFSFEN